MGGEGVRVFILCPADRYGELGRAAPPPPCGGATEASHRRWLAAPHRLTNRPAPIETGNASYTKSRAARVRAPHVPRQLEVLLRFFIGEEVNGRYYDGMEVG